MSEQALFSLASNPSAVSSDMRRAALLARRLDPVDRGWLLDSLPVPQRAQLETLLVELAELGIPDDASVLQQVLDEAKTALPTRGDDHHYLRHLSGEKIPVLGMCLRAEPPALTRQLLQIEDWPWHEQLLVALDAGRRHQVEALPRCGAAPGTEAHAKPTALAPRLQQALVKGIAQRVRILSNEAAAAASTVSATSAEPGAIASSLLGRILRPVVLRFRSA